MFTPEQIALMASAFVPLVMLVMTWASAKMSSELRELRRDNERREKRDTKADADLIEVRENVRQLTNGDSVHKRDEPGPRE